MPRTASQTEPISQERIEVSSLEEKLASVSEAVAAEPVPDRLLREANALQEAWDLARQRKNPN
jgi:hypothetical protein